MDLCRIEMRIIMKSDREFLDGIYAKAEAVKNAEPFDNKAIDVSEKIKNSNIEKDIVDNNEKNVSNTDDIVFNISHFIRKYAVAAAAVLIITIAVAGSTLKSGKIHENEDNTAVPHEAEAVGYAIEPETTDYVDNTGCDTGIARMSLEDEIPENSSVPEWHTYNYSYMAIYDTKLQTAVDLNVRMRLFYLR